MFSRARYNAKYLFLTLSATLLSACGGGGGGGSDGASAQTPHGSLAIAEADSDHDGLIEISNLQQLDWIRNDIFGNSLTDSDHQVNSKGCPANGCFGYELVADLNFDTNGDGVIDNKDSYFDYEKNGSNAGWLPIPRLTAVFEGNGHHISNLFIDRSTTDYVGLFSAVASSADKSAAIRNLKIDGPLVSVNGRNSIGALAGQLLVVGQTEITNTMLSGHVTGTGNFVGGTIGEVVVSGGSLIFANNSAASTISSQHGIAGGLVGGIYRGLTGEVPVSITNNVASSNVTGESAGGLIGSFSLGTATGIFENNSSSGNVVSHRFNAGGLLGTVYETTNTVIRAVHSNASVSATGELPTAGGLIGTIDNSTSLTITDSYTTGTVTSSGEVGGLIGKLHCSQSDEITNSYSTSDVTGTYTIAPSGSSVAISGGGAGGLIGAISSLYGAPNGTCNISSSYSSGNVSGGPYSGGLIGSIDAYETNTIISLSDSFSSGSVNAEVNAGGVFGHAWIAQSSSLNILRTMALGSLAVGTVWITPNSAGGIGGELALDSASTSNLSFNQWAADTTATTYTVYISSLAVVQTGNLGATRTELECPVTSDNVGCAAGEIFHSWGTVNNSQGQPLWDFGSTAQLPGLRLADGIHRPVYDGSMYAIEVEAP